MISDWSGDLNRPLSMQITRRLDRPVKGGRRHETVNIRSSVGDLSGIPATYAGSTLVMAIQEVPPVLPMEVPMQSRLARSWSALRYELSSQRALDNAARMMAEHDRLLAEIDAL